MDQRGSYSGQMHKSIDNDWLIGYANNDNAYVDCRDFDSTNTGRRGHPIGILVGSNSDGTSTVANVKMVLFGENHAQADTYTLTTGVIHPLEPKLLYANHTTGRNIKIFYGA